jgi:phage shock protein C
MERIISVHLSNKIFQIEEPAYNCLINLLNNNQWNRNELETQIAERLEKKLNNNKTILTYPDVVEVLYQLGFSPYNIQTKKLYRQPKGKTIGGVCSGLGEYFDIDPVIFKIAFVVCFFMGFVGFFTYIILWAIIPEKSKI